MDLSLYLFIIIFINDSKFVYMCVYLFVVVVKIVTVGSGGLT